MLVDPADEGLEPSLLFLLTHEIKSGDGAVLSKRLQFVRVGADGNAAFAGWAPHLDLEPLPSAERSLLKDVLTAPWIAAGQEARALALAAGTLVPEHYGEVAHRRITHVEKTLAAVHERLSKEIGFWQDRWMKLKEDGEAGKDVRLNLDNARRTIADLESRLDGRKKELQAMRHVVNGTPVVLGGALIVPAGLMNRLRGDEPADPVASTFAADAAARKRIEQLAMNAVRRAEEARGCRVVDVSAAKCGWDLTSYPPDRRRQAAATASHRSEGPDQRRWHRLHHAQRDALRLQPGRQVRARDRARWGGRRRRGPALRPQPFRSRTRLGHRVHQLQPGRPAWPAPRLNDARRIPSSRRRS